VRGCGAGAWRVWVQNARWTWPKTIIAALGRVDSARKPMQYFILARGGAGGQQATVLRPAIAAHETSFAEQRDPGLGIAPRRPPSF
jgi:hypothetical protein